MKDSQLIIEINTRLANMESQRRVIQAEAEKNSNPYPARELRLTANIEFAKSLLLWVDKNLGTVAPRAGLARECLGDVQESEETVPEYVMPQVAARLLTDESKRVPVDLEIRPQTPITTWPPGSLIDGDGWVKLDMSSLGQGSRFQLTDANTGEIKYTGRTARSFLIRAAHVGNDRVVIQIEEDNEAKAKADVPDVLGPAAASDPCSRCEFPRYRHQPGAGRGQLKHPFKLRTLTDREKARMARGHAKGLKASGDPKKEVEAAEAEATEAEAKAEATEATEAKEAAEREVWTPQMTRLYLGREATEAEAKAEAKTEAKEAAINSWIPKSPC